jgi:hypothetical protein
LDQLFIQVPRFLVRGQTDCEKIQQYLFMGVWKKPTVDQTVPNSSVLASC